MGGTSPKKKHFLNSKVELDINGDYPSGTLGRKSIVSPFVREGGNHLDNRDQCEWHFREMHKASVNLVAASNKRIIENITPMVSSQDMFRNQRSGINDLRLMNSPTYRATEQ
jgi:hypothetical protein